MASRREPFRFEKMRERQFSEVSPITDAEVLEAIHRLGWDDLVVARDGEGSGAAEAPVEHPCDDFRDGKKLIGRDLGSKSSSSDATEAGFSIKADMMLKETPGGK